MSSTSDHRFRRYHEHRYVSGPDTRFEIKLWKACTVCEHRYDFFARVCPVESFDEEKPALAYWEMHERISLPFGGPTCREVQDARLVGEVLDE